MLQKVANDYSNYVDQDVKSKLEPLNVCVDSMLARLEELQTMVTFVEQDVQESTTAYSVIAEYKDTLKDLCNRIDVLENVVDHIKSNLNSFENEIDKAEEKLRCTESTIVSNILTPFFKKTAEKKSPSCRTPIFQVKDYFEDEANKEK